jgi:hypothetical protein
MTTISGPVIVNPQGFVGIQPEGSPLDDSLLEGDLFSPLWRTIASNYKPEMRANIANRTAPDGQVYPDATHWNAYSNGQGITWNLIRHVAEFSGTMTFTVPAWLATGRTSDKISIVIGNVSNSALASTLCTLTATQQDFSVSYTVTAGTVYTLWIRQDDDASYGSASAQAFLGRPRVSYSSATGTLANAVWRVPGKPALFHGNGRHVVGNYGYYTSPWAELVIRTNAPSIVIETECTDGALAAGYSAVSVFIGAPGEIPVPWAQVSPTVANTPHRYTVALPTDGKVREVRIRNSPQSGVLATGTWVHAVYVQQNYVLEIVRPSGGNVLAVFGDSMSQGQTSIDAFSYDWSHARSVWAWMRQRYHGQLAHEGGGGITLATAGWQYISGVLQTGAAYTVTRPAVLRAINKLNPTEVLIMIGTNDWANNGSSKADWKSAITLFVDELRAACPTAYQWIVGPLHRTGDSTPNSGGATIADYNAAITELVAATDTSGLARSRFATAIDGTTLMTLTEVGQGDGTHVPAKIAAKVADGLALAMGW